MELSTVLSVWAVLAVVAILFIRGATRGSAQGSDETEKNEQHDGQLQGAGNE